MRKFVLFLLYICVALSQVYAQNRTITGVVTDRNGKPVADASVVARPSGGGTTTDANGRFSLTVTSATRSLEFSAVNFGSQTISLSSRATIDVRLDPTEGNLAEVVVVGYGVQRTVRENIGAVSKIDGAKIAELPLASFDQALAGKTAGVQVNATGGLLADGVAIRVRGVNSISSSSQPLVVIDGVPQITVVNLNGFNGGDGTRFNPFALVNPNDIESIEVLKDAGSSVIYGSRAANGVILITTKRGKRGTARVTLDVKYGFARPSQLPNLLNGDDFNTIQNEKAANRFGATSPNAVVARDSDLDGDGRPDRVNWLDEVYRTAAQQDYTIAFSGGSEKASFYGSVRYADMEGTTVGNRLTTGQTRLNIDITPKTWFRSGIELSYTRSLNKGVLSDRYLAGTVTSGWQAPPTLSPYKPSGPSGYNLTLAPTSPIGVLDWGNNTRAIGSTLIFPFNFYNPIASVALGRNDNTAEEIRANAFGEIQPIKGLKFTSKFGVQYLRNFEDQYTPPVIAGLGQPYNGLVQNQDQNWSLWNWQNYMSFDRVIAGDHKVGFVGGAEFQKDRYRYLYTGAANFSDPFFTSIIDGSYTNVQPGTTTTLNLTGGDKTSSGIESYFARVNYGFKSKYFIEGSVRRDAFSGFGEDFRWGTFPSISLGWEVTKERFMQNIKSLDYLKIRGSYGRVGNSRGVGAYASRALYGGATYTVTTGLGNTQFGNAALRWESSDKFDIGLEANFLKNRIGIIIDYFKNDINNLILNAPVIYTVGVPGASIPNNIGGMYNRGIEFTLNATPVAGKDFKWTTSFNYTKIKNEVTGLVPANNNADINSGLSVASVGRPLGTYFIPNWAGVDAATGNPMWYGANGGIKRYNFGATGAAAWTDEKGTPVAALGTADYVYQDRGGLPTWYGGWDNNLTYKNFDLSISMMYQGGNYIYNGTRAQLLTNFFSNNFEEIKNRWTTPGQVTDIPKLWLLDNTANQASTRFLEKGDFLRVRSITLAYNLNRRLVDLMGITGLRVYGQVFNAFTFTKYSGADPEVNTNRFDNIAIGVDTRNVPQSRTFTFGIQASF